MCGIAGICRYRGNGIDDILKMNEKMNHRGPDSGNYWVDKEERIVLGHRRLSIVDLSLNAAQPMESLCGRYVICFNGEIYNYEKIKRQMIADGHILRLRSTSDTEIILYAFAKYGIKKTLELIKGMFAIALWDREEKKLYLMRDRVGEKPLYYGYVNGSFVFASDIVSIEAIQGFRNEFRMDVMQMYFQYGYIPAPYSIYKDIFKLLPGHCMSIGAPFTNTLVSKPYWSMEQMAKQGQTNLYKGSEKEATEHLEVLLKDAIDGQMIADVPVGAFLSGGIDSALIVSLMQSMKADKVKTFTIGFEVDQYNEATYAKDISRHLGTEHTELYVGKKEALKVIQELPMAFSEPFADSSQIPTMLVSKMTREHVTVSLSGDGGDELFCGYNTYRIAEAEMVALRKKVGNIPNFARHRLGKISKTIAGPYCKNLYKMGNYFTIDTPEESHRRMGLEDSRFPFIARNHMVLPHSNITFQDGTLSETEHNLMLMDLLQYHVDDILVKVDRAGMYYSLESRIPLLDKDVVEFAWQLPLHYKYGHGTTKRIMRNILYKYVPKEMMERPKKGFSIPLAEWFMEGDLREWAEDILAKGRRECGEFLDTKIIDSLWSDYIQHHKWTEKIWYILMMEQWLQSRL